MSDRLMAYVVLPTLIALFFGAPLGYALSHMSERRAGIVCMAFTFIATVICVYVADRRS